MKFFTFSLFLFNIIIEFCYVVGQVSEECKIYNQLNNLDINNNCCTGKCLHLGKNVSVCDSNGQVICLNLNKNLEVIPEEIGSLVNLKYLNLNNNKIKTIPEFFLNFKNLDTLELDINQLNEVPEVVTKLPSLSVLILSRNNLKELPPSIGNLSSLTYLNLAENFLTSFPKEIGKLVNINKINCSTNKVSHLPDEIGNLENMTDIYFNNNNLETLPSTFGNLKSLTTLVLRNNTSLRSLPNEFFNLNLKTLWMDNCAQLEVKFVNFPFPAEKCILFNTHLSCYQKGTCKQVNVHDTSLNGEYIPDSEYVASGVRICTEEDVQSVKEKPSNSKTLIYIGIIALIILAVINIGYIYHLKSKKNKNNKKNLGRQHSSDVIIYEKHPMPSSVLPTSNISDVHSKDPIGNYKSYPPTVDSTIDISSVPDVCLAYPVTAMTTPSVSTMAVIDSKSQMPSTVSYDPFVAKEMLNKKEELFSRETVGEDNTAPPSYSLIAEGQNNIQ